MYISWVVFNRPFSPSFETANIFFYVADKPLDLFKKGQTVLVIV